MEARSTSSGKKGTPKSSAATRNAGSTRGNGAAPKTASSSKKGAAKKPAAKRKSAKKKPVKALESFNPATGELVGTVETLTPAKVEAVVDDVAGVQPFWAQLSLADRARYMLRAADVLLEEMDELAELLTLEQGKPRL